MMDRTAKDEALQRRTSERHAVGCSGMLGCRAFRTSHVRPVKEYAVASAASRAERRETAHYRCGGRASVRRRSRATLARLSQAMLGLRGMVRQRVVAERPRAAGRFPSCVLELDFSLYSVRDVNLTDHSVSCEPPLAPEADAARRLLRVKSSRRAAICSRRDAAQLTLSKAARPPGPRTAARRLHRVVSQRLRRGMGNVEYGIDR